MVVSPAVLVVKKDQSDADGAEQEGEEDVQPPFGSFDTSLGGSKHLGNSNVQKDSSPNGENGPNANVSGFGNQHQDTTNYYHKTKEKVEQQGRAGSDSVLVDHDEVPGKLVRNLVNDGGQRDGVSKGGSALHVGGTDEDTIGKVVEGLSEVVRQEERKILEADTAAGGVLVFVLVGGVFVGALFGTILGNRCHLLLRFVNLGGLVEIGRGFTG